MSIEAITWKWPTAEVFEQDGVITWHPESPVTEKTQVEIDAAIAEYNARDVDGEEYDQLMARSDKMMSVLKKLIVSLNNGTFVPGGNISNAQLKAFFK